jgi:hypothetical protein
MVKDHHHYHLIWAEDYEISVLEEMAIPEMKSLSPDEGGEDDPG